MENEVLYINNENFVRTQPTTISVQSIYGIRIQLDEPTDIRDVYQFCLHVAREMKPKQFRPGDLVADIMPIVPIQGA